MTRTIFSRFDTPGRRSTVPVLLGPTASGKSRLAMEIAAADERVEIVSADSRQIYRQISIGTAKPHRQDLESVTHHCIDIADIDERFSAGRFAELARGAIREILSRNGIPLVVGGTGFYIRALFGRLDAPPLSGTTLQSLTERAAIVGISSLYTELTRVDPVAAERIPATNRERIIRALGCYLETGRPYSSFRSDPAEGRDLLAPSYLLLSPPVEPLNQSIEERTDEMIGRGLVDEIRSLLDRGYSPDAPGLRTVGYREGLALLRGEIDAAEFRRRTVVATRRYAKRQRTWFRNQVVPDIIVEKTGGLGDVPARWVRVCSEAGEIDRGG